MKKHLSVFVFMSRYMLWPTLLVSVLGAAAGMALFIFLMVQGAVCLFYGLWLQNNGYGSAGNMSLLVAMVTSTPTHAMFPLGDWPVYIRMAAVLFTLGCSTAYSGFISRRGKLALSPFVLLALAWFTDAVFAPVGEYTYEALIAAVCAISLASMLISIHSREQDDDGVSDYDAAGGEQLGQN